MPEPAATVRKKPFLGRGALIAMGVAMGLTLACFAVVAYLPPPEGPLFKDPLRSFLTAVGVAGVAYTLCALGAALQRKFEISPYFEGAFIAGVLSFAGYICAIVALVCVGFGVYDLILWLMK